MRNLLSQKVRETVQAVLQHPVIMWLRKRYPRPFYFIIYRFSTTSFMGLPLTLLVTVFMLNMLLLSQLTEEVVESNGVIMVDEHFTASIYSVRSEWLSSAFFLLTQLGGREAVFIVGAIITGVFLYRQRYVAILAFWLMAGGAGLSARYGKKIISRDRPADVAYYQERYFSFPSGHATTAASNYGFIGYLLFRHYRRRSYRNIVFWATSIIIGLVGFSRIYLGVHFLTDVLAGFLLGGMWLLIGISLMEVMSYRKALGARNEEDVI
ncbi:phosphatase PAP2 family protein [Botryobacter ruber]|uniref:phosphatase PAP2 family protein n=1 Tax=Botryobacter ruber TaxID=2171629 RepID=UPI000E0C5200|nr:phosphatase PAP2 family protein [Botryobacter ruber]